MKSKIEKLKIFFKKEDVSFEKVVIEKINEIIDHLNSQDQEENEPEKVYVDPIVPDFIAEKLAEERYNTREILLNGTKPLEVEDTPEEKEEWEKEFELPDEIEHEDCIEVLADKHKLWEICSWEEPELDPDKVVAFIKQLLEERECRAREEWTEELRQAFYDTFYKSGELWFDYIFEDGDTKAEQNAKEVVEEYWKEIISKLTTK